MIKSVIVGCGAISSVHEQGIKQSGVLYGVCDIDAERMNKYDVKHFGSIDEVLKDDNVDCVHICTPHYLHAEMLHKVVKSGRAAAVEKPVALNLPQIMSVYDEIKDGKICVMLQNRYNTCIKELKRIISAEEYGRVKGLKGILTWERTPEYYMHDSWRGKYATEGGGLVINQAVHTLDLLEYLGGNAVKIKASADTRVLNDVIEVEDTAEATLWLENDVRAMFYATNGYASNSSYDIEVVCEKAVFRYIWGKLYLCNKEGEKIICDDSGECNGKKYWGASHNEVVNNFYRSLMGEKASYPVLDDGIKAQKLVDGLYKSAKSGEIEYL